MRESERPYPGQLDRSPGLLYVAIPRSEIIGEMARRDPDSAIDDVCFAVVVVADLLRDVLPAKWDVW
jgi:hypothetical protein